MKSSQEHHIQNPQSSSLSFTINIAPVLVSPGQHGAADPMHAAPPAPGGRRMKGPATPGHQPTDILSGGRRIKGPAAPDWVQLYNAGENIAKCEENTNYIYWAGWWLTVSHSYWAWVESWHPASILPIDELQRLRFWDFGLNLRSIMRKRSGYGLICIISFILAGLSPQIAASQSMNGNGNRCENGDDENGHGNNGNNHDGNGNNGNGNNGNNGNGNNGNNGNGNNQF